MGHMVITSQLGSCVAPMRVEAGLHQDDGQSKSEIVC